MKTSTNGYPQALETSGETQPGKFQVVAERADPGQVKATAILDNVPVHSAAFPFSSQKGWDKFARKTLAKLDLDTDPTAIQRLVQEAQTEPTLLNLVNYRTREDKQTDPLTINDIATELYSRTDGWPQRVGDTLFWENPEHEIEEFPTPVKFQSWIQDQLGGLDWQLGRRFVTQEQFFEHLKRKARNWAAAETLPHWPAVENIYYTQQEIPDQGNGALEDFLDFFCPATPVDRELIRAFVLTLFWGGLGGHRPVFLVTGPDQDDQRGRGVGKSSLVNWIGKLTPHVLDVKPDDKITKTKGRLLTGPGRQVRLAVIDNLKSHKFGWADLEGLITSPDISGHKMWAGESDRPNLITWGITLNGANLSKDMSQRVIPIKVNRPAKRFSWAREIDQFIKSRHLEILADIRDLLQADPPEITQRIRWELWESEVLSRVNLVAECQQTILERQRAIDGDQDETEVVADFLRDQLARGIGGQKLNRNQVSVSSQDMADLIDQATGRKLSLANVKTYLANLGIPELDQRKAHGVMRWLWTGPDFVPGTRRLEYQSPRSLFSGR